MNDKLQRFLENLLPFLVSGIGIALVIGIFIMFSYVLIWGILIGVILWLVSLVKGLLFTSASSHKKPTKAKGRIIEHNEKD